MKTTQAPVVTLTGITKQFPGVKALDDVDLTLFPGEVHALLGENGAGKSTLVKILTGVHRADAGEIRVDGVPVQIHGPGQAVQAGISTVYQEVNLLPNLTVAENVMIGREPRGPLGIRWGELRRQARALLARAGLDLDVGLRLGACPVAVQQLVAIVRALGVDAKVLVLDEPTSSLDRDEVEQLFTVMRRLRDDGVAIVFITHFLDQIYEICDRMTVLRNGRRVGEHLVRDLPRLDLVRLMLGKELDALDQLAPRATVRADDEIVHAQALGRRGGVAPFDLTVHAGEVVGLAGLLGSGRTEVARLLFGADQADTGRLTIGGTGVTLRSPATAVHHGVAFCSENRKEEGLVLDLSVRENILLALQASRGWLRPLPAARRAELVDEYVAALDIRPADPDRPVGTLSGGNQQKVLLARWLITRPKLLVLDEPTRGIDVGAKAEIQRLVLGLSQEGLGLVYISAELEEVLRLSHTVAVLRDRELIATLTNSEDVDTARLLATIAGGEQS